MARPRTDIQQRIVRAAHSSFLAQGVDGASLRTIAREAATNIGMVFYYFATKDELFLAVVEEVYSKLLDDLGRILEDPRSLRERFARAFARIGGASDQELEVIRLVVREALLSSGRFKRILARAQRGHLAMLLAALAEGVGEGELDEAVPMPLLLLCTLGIGGMPQLIRRAVGDHEPFAHLPRSEALAELSVDLLFRAIGPRDERRSLKTRPKRRPTARARRR